MNTCDKTRLSHAVNLLSLRLNMLRLSRCAITSDGHTIYVETLVHERFDMKCSMLT